jgi:hypothetical protein
MTVLNKLVRQVLESQCETLGDEQTCEDVLRAFAEQAQLLYQTEYCRNTLRADPFENLSDIKPQIERLCPLLQVTDYHKVVNKAGYCSIDAVVRIDADDDMKNKGGVESMIELYFSYEKNPTPGPPDSGMTVIWYTIDASYDHGPREQCLHVQVFASKNHPSVEKALNIHEEIIDENEDWATVSDYNEDEEEDEMDNSKDAADRVVEKIVKRARLDMLAANNEEDNIGLRENPVEIPEPDKYMADIESGNMDRFLHKAQLQPITDVVSCILLMTFPFYEHEWDILRFLLDAVFGPDGESVEDEDVDVGDLGEFAHLAQYPEPIE